MTEVRVLDRVARHAALGLRFWDAAEATSAIDGLLVEVFPRTNPLARSRAYVNRSGVYVAHALPGLREFEFSDAEPDVLWLTATHRYRVEVRDPFDRFLPFAFDADAPARGLFTWGAPWFSPPQPIVFPGEPGSPPQLMLERIPLFSAPTRPLPDPLAVVRAQLREFGTDREAAWTLLGLSIDGEARGLGLADMHGRVAVIFPYPEPPRMSLVSPPEARNDFTWQVDLTAYVPPHASPPTLPVPDIADLGDVFAALANPRAVIESIVSPALPLRLTYRQPLTVRTAGAMGDGAAFLFIAA
jgi:hypothetical protein